jgi:hypothetical protein
MPSTPTRTAEQAAEDARDRQWKRLRQDAIKLRVVARPWRAKALARILLRARSAGFEDGLDAELLNRAGYNPQSYCADLLGPRVTRPALLELLLQHIVVGTADHPVIGMERALRLHGFEVQLAEAMRRLPFPDRGKGSTIDGKPAPAIRKLVERGYISGERLPIWLLNYVLRRGPTPVDAPVQEDAGAEPRSQARTAEPTESVTLRAQQQARYDARYTETDGPTREDDEEWAPTVGLSPEYVLTQLRLDHKARYPKHPRHRPGAPRGPRPPKPRQSRQ